MAFWNFVIYAKTDFSVVDFDGNTTTNASITPIYITVEDNDPWLGGSITPFQDTNGLQTISSSSDPSLVGLDIALHQPVDAFSSTLAQAGPPAIRIVDLSIDGNADYVLSLVDGGNGELQTSTTYTDNQPGSGQAGIGYSSAALPCFANGSLILTPQGEVAVETLSKGDRVMTADSGIQPIGWIGQRTITTAEMRLNPRFRPVRIAAGAMGCGLPTRDLLVSRQHRMLVRSDMVERVFGTREALVPAIHLVGLPGIAIEDGLTDVTYVHFLCQRHEVVYAESCPTETLYLGPQLLDPAADEAVAMFPGLKTDSYSLLPARLLAKGKHAKRLTEALVRVGAHPLAGKTRSPAAA